MTEEYSAADKAALIPEDKWNTALDVLQTLYVAARERIPADKINADMITHILAHMMYQRDTDHVPTVIEPPAGIRYRRPNPAMSWHLWDNPGEMPLPDDTSNRFLPKAMRIKADDGTIYSAGRYGLIAEKPEPENPFADLAKYWEKEE